MPFQAHHRPLKCHPPAPLQQLPLCRRQPSGRPPPHLSSPKQPSPLPERSSCGSARPADASDSRHCSSSPPRQPWQHPPQPCACRRSRHRRPYPQGVWKRIQIQGSQSGTSLWCGSAGCQHLPTQCPWSPRFPSRPPLPDALSSRPARGCRSRMPFPKGLSHCAWCRRSAHCRASQCRGYSC